VLQLFTRWPTRHLHACFNAKYDGVSLPSSFIAGIRVKIKAKRIPTPEMQLCTSPDSSLHFRNEDWVCRLMPKAASLSDDHALLFCSIPPGSI